MKKRGKKKKSKKKNRWLYRSILLMAVLSAPVLIFFTVRAFGKAGLYKKAEKEMQELSAEMGSEALSVREQEIWEEGWVKYKNQIYAYKKDMLCFLFMGIDKENEVTEAVEGTGGGQADALFLLVMNQKEQSLQVVSINRNTMAEIRLYDETGAYLTTTKAQIAVQHGFGNGLEESCEYQMNAVRRLFYNIPIHGYCAINMDAVTTLTDLAGGVELTAIEEVRSAKQDETLGEKIVNQGETVLLDGRKAYSYVRYRRTEAEGSADLRLERQKQFLAAYIQKIRREMKKDLTLPVKLYQAAAARMVTDVTMDEAAYLASEAVNYSFDGNCFYTLQGETKQGEVFEEYHIDETALYELILELFYEPVVK